DLDLGRELAGRREDEGARPARGLLHESLQDRQKKRSGLPRSGLGRANDVATRQDGGDRLLLDRGGSFVAEAVDGSKEDRVEAEEVEGVLRVRRLHRGSYGFIGLRVRVIPRDYCKGPRGRLTNPGEIGAPHFAQKWYGGSV